MNWVEFDICLGWQSPGNLPTTREWWASCHAVQGNGKALQGLIRLYQVCVIGFYVKLYLASNEYRDSIEEAMK